MHAFLVSHKEDFQSVVDHLQKDFNALRTGRASPALVEDIKIQAYGAIMDIKSVASIMTQDAKTLVIEPWDKSMTQAIEKGIREANVGINPAVDGSTVRISLPQMTEENRRHLVKQMKEREEEAKVSARGVRENVREQVMAMEKAKEIGEDEKFKTLDELDKMTKEYTTRIEDMATKKEEEIMTV
ncbi:TPA: ribosome recycling factor [Candidatus Uhrbacteria bacterium]|uniref:Ribosome-recycling factor n=2 Tax=Candidatus Uhriibacteriota TaxID=1752732 RepID=A0A0G1Q7Z2_9BACT|nr:MAG: Ribosome-recycling factor [Candidatus Uhrbacteria bacterium GW2011_GWF2_46_218]KKU41099.1 MAG: Ribosome-recycling factor [Candidatus Uhrbacteria bacterium GW2011_GWE2_46_68]HBK34280.1 ribosome recycling factor [Candidatus Uhrbacteria bacterium]HCB19234.1 ribosome recycling factor [Candidatus Uhrbacteria bacterium]